MEAEIPSLLPAHIMQEQLGLIDLLVAMFPPTSSREIEIISESARQCIDTLRDWCLDPTSTPIIPSMLPLVVTLPIAGGDKTIQVTILVPLKCEDPATIDQPPSLRYTVRQPDWMTKAEVAELAASVPQVDAFEAFEYIQEGASQLLENKQCQAMYSQGPRLQNSKSTIVRVWFYFPSLSTRKKRDDMVNLAPGYSLTGFVLAGKPGVLCLEGASIDVDAYMSFIKTHSWGDIPSHQKKVSERFRQTENVERVFSGMEEITDSLGERGGQRANRGDMQALEVWLEAKGLQEAFKMVIF
ncbi:hypothetical protein N7466_006652 [Penicillium verhagenii]|uniref:uncharacterized protein n=1 Tax=Penicillium verhagenii TaxID=1562060 RepID=UPI00254581AC|nr:uncharacterized protein N7466_006652 [Penicillium verhagenii]KAJ5931159.1 hypothetical protein N7466_006652 [Penicillium verhagenii]